MRRLRDRILLMMVVILIASPVEIHSDDSAAATFQGVAVDNWLRDKYRSMLDLVLPLDKTNAQYLPKDVRWMVIIRIVGPYSESESRLSLQMTYQNDVVSVFSSPVPSLLSQLRSLKSDKRGAPDEEIARLISVKHRNFTVKNCSEINRLARDFENLRLSPVLPDELIMDGTSYEVWSRSQWGNEWILKYHGPGPQEPVQPFPLFTWVETARELFARTCVSVR